MPTLVDVDLEGATTKELALIFDCSERKIDGYVKKGMPTTQSGHRKMRHYNVIDCIKWRIQDARNQAAGIKEATEDNSIEKLIAERGEKAAADYFRAQLLKLDLDKAKGVLVPVEQMQEDLRSIATEFRKSMQDLGAEMSVALARLSDPDAIKSTINERVYAILLSLKNKYSPDDVTEKEEDTK